MFKNDKQMILNEDEWPNWPVLPLKKKDSSEVATLLMPIEGKGYTLVLMNMFLFYDAPTGKKLPTKQYGSVDEILADGWVVD